MWWLTVPAIGLVTVVLVVVRVVDLRRLASEPHPLPDVGVTLSVLPNRTAVITLGLGADARSAAVASLVNHAVNEAFAFDSVGSVEVRSSDGRLLDRPRRETTV